MFWKQLIVLNLVAALTVQSLGATVPIRSTSPIVTPCPMYGSQVLALDLQSAHSHPAMKRIGTIFREVNTAIKRTVTAARPIHLYDNPAAFLRGMLASIALTALAFTVVRIFNLGLSDFAHQFRIPIGENPDILAKKYSNTALWFAGPFMEEILFRGALLGAVKWRQSLADIHLTSTKYKAFAGRLRAIPRPWILNVVHSAFFSGAHFVAARLPWGNAFAYSGIGIILGSLTLCTGSLLPGMMTHMLNNYLSSLARSNYSQFQVIVKCLPIVSAALIWVIHRTWKEPKALALDEADSPLIRTDAAIHPFQTVTLSGGTVEEQEIVRQALRELEAVVAPELAVQIRAIVIDHRRHVIRRVGFQSKGGNVLMLDRLAIRGDLKKAILYHLAKATYESSPETRSYWRRAVKVPWYRYVFSLWTSAFFTLMMLGATSIPALPIWLTRLCAIGWVAVVPLSGLQFAALAARSRKNLSDFLDANSSLSRKQDFITSFKYYALRKNVFRTRARDNAGINRRFLAVRTAHQFA